MANVSQALVKVESKDYKKKLRSCVMNRDLPSDLTTNDIWTKKVLPTLFCWLAAQANPWVPIAQDMEKAIQLIGRHYVSDDYDLEKDTVSPEFQLVRQFFSVHLVVYIKLIQAIQRLSDTWKIPIKNTALWAAIGFFDSNKNFFNKSDKERQKWAAEAFDEQKFTYSLVKAMKVHRVRKIVNFYLMFNFIFF